MNYSKKSWAVSALAISALVGYAHQAHADGLPQLDQNVFVLDMSGSMGESATASKTKLTVMKERANAHLLETQARTNPQRYEVRTFQDAGSNIAIPFSQGATAADVKAYLDLLISPDGATPLAGAACSAIDSTQTFETQWLNVHTDYDFSNKYVYVLTDGLENGTPPPGSENSTCDVMCTRCQGDEIDPAVLNDPNLDPLTLPANTWARKMYNTAMSGDPTNMTELPPFLRVIVNIDALFTFIPTGQSLMDVRQPEADSTQGFSIFLSGSPYTDEITPGWESYFKKTSIRTNGRYTAVKPNATGTTTVLSGSLVGDINKDGCVGKVDYNKLHQTDTWMQKVVPNKPHLYAADLDQDGWVRANDHRLLLANYGKGTCLPADL